MVRRWYQRGMRPRMVKDQRYRSAYIFRAVCPARDTGAALFIFEEAGRVQSLTNLGWVAEVNT